MYRNNLLRTIVFSSLILALCTGGVMAQALLDPVAHPKYANLLPTPARLDATMLKGKLDIEMREIQQNLGLVDAAGNPLTTTVWGYGDITNGVTYPGPTIVAHSGSPVRVKWRNNLPKTYDYPMGVMGPAHLLPLDVNNHNAHPAKGGIPAVVHLHGGHTESASDGLPEQWYTQGWKETGPQWVKKEFYYDNDQEAATLWYHDHALGITRLNVYAGLAGFYLLRDPNEDGLVNTGVLPGGPYEIEVVIQDRMFTADGQLFLPSTGPEIEPTNPITGQPFLPLPAGPSLIAEFFGDFILVNGAPWPVMNVEPRKYRLRLLNGSDSRFYVLEFRDSATGGGTTQQFYQIGTDDGLLPTPVAMTQLLIAPGERADLVVDFTGQTEVFLRNFGPDEPFKGFNPDGTITDGEGGVVPPADEATTGQVMKFAVNLPMSGTPNASVAMGTVLRPEIVALTPTGTGARSLVLFEGFDEFGRLQPMLGTLAEGSMTWSAPITENPMLNDIEIWEVYNTTADAHPIHLHMVSFQILDRYEYEGTVTEIPVTQHNGAQAVGGVLTVDALGAEVPIPDNEKGWKDTMVMLPGQRSRVIAKFDRPGRYVWHCHILSHEDHEMMRPFFVGPMGGIVGGPPGPPRVASNDVPTAHVALEQNYPNPFNPSTEIGFSLNADTNVDVQIYNVAGQLVRTLASSQSYPAGRHVLTWDGRDGLGNVVSTGVYFYKLQADGITQIKKMVMVR